MTVVMWDMMFLTPDGCIAPSVMHFCHPVVIVLGQWIIQEGIMTSDVDAEVSVRTMYIYAYKCVCVCVLGVRSHHTMKVLALNRHM